LNVGFLGINFGCFTISIYVGLSLTNFVLPMPPADVQQPEVIGERIGPKQWKEEEKDVPKDEEEKKRKSNESGEEEEDESETKYLIQSNDQAKNIGGG
jgi:hypothetical protein